MLHLFSIPHYDKLGNISKHSWKRLPRVNFRRHLSLAFGARSRVKRRENTSFTVGPHFIQWKWVESNLQTYFFLVLFLNRLSLKSRARRFSDDSSQFNNCMEAIQPQDFSDDVLTWISTTNSKKKDSPELPIQLLTSKIFTNLSPSVSCFISQIAEYDYQSWSSNFRNGQLSRNSRVS